MTTRSLVAFVAVTVAVGVSVLLAVTGGRSDDLQAPSDRGLPAQNTVRVASGSPRAVDPYERAVVGRAAASSMTVPLSPFPGRDEFGRERLLANDAAATGARLLTVAEGSVPTLDPEPTADGQGRAVLVEIVDAQGLPLSGAQVGLCVLSHDVWLEGGHRVHWGRSDAQGRAAVAECVPCGRWKVAAGPGIELVSPEVEIPEGPEETLLTLRVVGRRVDMLAGGVSVRPDAARHLHVICAVEVPEQGLHTAARVIASTAIAPDGSFELTRPPGAPAEVRLGCLMRDGNRWFSDLTFRWGDDRCVLVPPLPGSLELRVLDSRGMPVERFAVLLGADSSKSLQGAATSVTNAGFHEGGILTIQDCPVGDIMLRVLPMDDGLPPSDVLQVRVQPGLNHVTVRLARAWDLLVAVSLDGKPVVGAKVEIIGGPSRAAARDIDYTPVFNGRLVPDIESIEHPVRIDSGATNRRGEVSFLLPAAGGPVSVRVSSDTLAILPAFVETVLRTDGESTVDVVVASGSAIIVEALDVPGSVGGKIRLGLRRVAPIEGAVNSFPIRWHHPRPELRDGKFRLYNVPRGEWIVDAYIGSELVQSEIARWTVLQPRHEWVLSLVALVAEKRAVSVAFAEQPGRVGQVEVVQLSGETDALGAVYPLRTVTGLTRAAFVRGRVKPVGGGGSQAWYSSRIFGPDEPIQATLRPWSLRLQLPQSLVGKKITVRGPTIRDQVHRDVRAAGIVTFDGVCPFATEVVVGEQVLASGTSLENAIRSGAVVFVE